MRDIIGYEGEYAVTSCGKVWSYKRQRFLVGSTSPEGYKRVTLSQNGHKRTIEVHRLVAQAYIPNPTGLPQVNHKDEIKAHNFIGNLEWCDAKYNANYGTGIVRAVANRSRTPGRKRPIYCIELNKEFESQAQAVREFNLCATTLNRVLSGKRQTCGGYHWRFVKSED